MSRVSIMALVFDERTRQEALKSAGKFKHTCADDIPRADKAIILGEEYGEVCRAICENDTANLHDELVQVMAICLAWLESLD